MPTRIVIAEDETLVRLDLEQDLSAGGFDVCGVARDGVYAVPAVVVPEADTAVGGAARRLRGGHAVDVEEERRDAAVHRPGPVQRHVVGKALDQAAAQGALVVAQDGKAAERLEVGD